MEQPVFELANGTHMPALGFGTFQLSGQECEDAVRHALEVGYRHIDTADMYGNHAQVRNAIQGYDRDDLFITTKIWRDDLRYDDVLKAGDRFIKELGSIPDLILIHWPNRDIPMAETFRGLKELLAAEKTRSVGVSNFTTTHLKEALRVSLPTLVNNQVEFHPFLYQKELLEFCRAKELVVTAYQPVAATAARGNDVLDDIARKHGKTPVQAVLRWLLQHGVAAIPRSKSPEHIRENWGALGWELDADDMSRIDGLNRNERRIDPDFAEFDLCQAAS